MIESNNQYSMMNEEYRIANKGSGKNIPVLRTLGYYAVSYSTNFTGALHLGFQTASTAISDTAAALRNTLSGNRRICRTSNGETAAAPQNIFFGNRRILNEKLAAAPRNICRTAGHPSGKKVQRTETLNRNVEYRITNIQ